MSLAPAFDRAALEALYLRLERPMFNVVHRRLWNEADAMDVVADAFVRLWHARDRIRPETAEAFAWRTVLNLASNRKRSQRLWAWLAFDAERDGDTTGGAEEAIEVRQREAAVRAAIEALPEKLRDVVLLSEFSELTQAEVAAVLDIPPGTVASRRHLASARLRADLEGA